MKGMSSQTYPFVIKYSLFKIFISFDINYLILGNFFLFKLHLPEAKLLENDFYMSENLNTENNLLVPSTRRNLFKGVATGLVAGSVAGPAILSGAKKGKKAGVKKGRINQSVVSWCFADLECGRDM